MNSLIVAAFALAWLSGVPAGTQSKSHHRSPAPCSIERELAEIPYPDSLRGTGVKGTVAVEAILDVHGCASHIEVVHKVHPKLDALVIAAVRTWKFRPALKDGKPVAAWVQIPINFEEDVWEKVSFH
jgi:TonB family protein